MTVCFHCNTPLVLPTDLISYQVWGVALRSGIQAEENWLPINRGDEEIDLQMRIYALDIEAYKK